MGRHRDSPARVGLSERRLGARGARRSGAPALRRLGGQAEAAAVPEPEQRHQDPVPVRPLEALWGIPGKGHAY